MKRSIIFLCLLPFLFSCSRVAEFLFEAETENKKISVTGQKATQDCYKEITDLKKTVDEQFQMPNFINRGQHEI